jgi:parallel beta-helix repeat protein
MENRRGVKNADRSGSLKYRALLIRAFSIMLVGFWAVAAAQWGGATLTVSAATRCVGLIGPGCDSSHPTIQAAVNAALSGDTVRVAAGVYNETVNVNKSLIILGAEAGNDARTRALVNESVMNNAGGAFNITASNVTIDGFTIQNASGPPLGTGIAIGGAVSGASILNNVIQNNTFGIYLNGSGHLVQRNLFRNNNLPGAASGNAIYSDQGLASTVVDNNNFFPDHPSSAMVVVGAVNTNLSFTNNRVEDTGAGDQAGIGLFNTDGATITGNTFSNLSTSGVYLGGNDKNINISGNVFTGPGDANSHNGVTIDNSPLGFGPNGPGITIQDNTFDGMDCAIALLDSDAITPATTVEVHGNRIVNSFHVGIINQSAGSVNAQGNWWGCNDAPDAGACNCNGVGSGLLDTEGPGAIDASNHLTLQLSVFPNPVAVGATATVNAVMVGTGAPITPVTFAATSGTINPTQANIDPVTDRASASYVSNQSGVYTISATVDCQTLSVAANVLDTFGGPGDPTPDRSEISDQKPGSILFYNFYTSSISNPAVDNTRINITNASPNLSVFVHLYFVDGDSCSVADAYICLTPSQTTTLLASDMDPGVRGYIVAVATDSRGCPIKYNYLIGDYYVKFPFGGSNFISNLAAESIAAVNGVDGQVVPGCSLDLNPPQVTLNFDGVSYNRVPRVLALDSFMSFADGNQTLLIVNRIGGSLLTSGNTIGDLFGLLYDSLENPKSFTLRSATCQYRRIIDDNNPRTTPRLSQFITAGNTGWMKFWRAADGGIFGSAINSNRNAGSNPSAFNHGHNLHKLTLTTESYTIPVFPPSCN